MVGTTFPHFTEYTPVKGDAISFQTHVHIPPFTELRTAMDIIVGHIHSSGVHHLIVDNHDFAMIAVQGVVHPWKHNRIEHDYLKMPTL